MHDERLTRFELQESLDSYRQLGAPRESSEVGDAVSGWSLSENRPTYSALASCFALAPPSMESCGQAFVTVASLGQAPGKIKQRFELSQKIGLAQCTPEKEY